MFHKNRTRKKDSKPKEAGYKLTYDNLAIPEVHTHEQPGDHGFDRGAGRRHL